MKRKTTRLLAVFLLLAGSLMTFWLTRSNRGPGFDLAPYQALGQGVAEQVSNLLGQKGEVVIVIPDPKEYQNPAMEAQVQTLRKVIDKQPALSIAGIEEVRMSQEALMATGGAPAQEHLLWITRKYPKAAAVLLFLPFPRLDSAHQELLRKTGIKFVVVSAPMPGYRYLLSEGLIHLAIVPRAEHPPGSPTKPVTWRQWFDRDYMVLAAENASQSPF